MAWLSLNIPVGYGVSVEDTVLNGVSQTLYAITHRSDCGEYVVVARFDDEKSIATFLDGVREGLRTSKFVPSTK